MPQPREFILCSTCGDLGRVGDAVCWRCGGIPRPSVVTEAAPSKPPTVFVFRFEQRMLWPPDAPTFVSEVPVDLPQPAGGR